VCPEGQRGLPRGRPPGALERIPTPQHRDAPRALIVEPHPAVRTVLEYLLGREGFRVEAFAPEEASAGEPGPALLLVAAEDGLYVFLSGNAAETLEGVVAGNGDVTGAFNGATGIRAFLPKPFGVRDVLQVVGMVGGFEGRRREHPRGA
jgi:FixJ family two-component response regulator